MPNVRSTRSTFVKRDISFPVLVYILFPQAFRSFFFVSKEKEKKKKKKETYILCYLKNFTLKEENRILEIQ